jgi:hypothetical protein
MTHKWQLLFLVPMIGGGLLFALGTQQPESPLTTIGLGLLGVGIILLGLDSIITCEAIFQHEESYTTETYTGFSAVVWGVCFVLVGLGIVSGAVIYGIGKDEAVLAHIGQHPGLALIYAGAIVLTMAIPGIIGSHEENRSRLALLGSVPGRLFAMLLTTTAALVLLAGVYELVSPTGFDELMQQIQSSLHRWPEY